jgi:phosphoglycerate kinase
MSGMKLPLLSDIDSLEGKKVIVRTSLDVPIHDGVVTNDFRVLRALPTISYLTERGAKVIILTHIGRDPESSAAPVAFELSKHIRVTYIGALLGEEVEQGIRFMKNGDVFFLGNLRSYPGEEANDASFAQTLASYADYYVNDAFAVSHRAHASIVGIPSYIPGFAGLTFAEEYEHLSKALEPEHPALFIIGGAKFETKLPLIERYAASYEQVFVGGALANDLIKAKGFEVGTSLLSPIDLRGTEIMNHQNIITPMDVVVDGGARGKMVTSVSDVQKDEKILDVGSASVEALKPYIMNARTILWNGPLGNYEGGFDEATKTCAKYIAESNAFSVVGGGDTVAAIESLGISDQFGFLSTAGGAMLEFLEKGTLPGIDALSKSHI